MKRALLILLLLVAAGGAAALIWWYTHRSAPTGELVLYGNVDLRQVQLAFNNSERIASIEVEEGNRVYKGQHVAKLDTRRLDPQVAQAEAQVALAKAQVAAQEQVVARLQHGSRPEEIAQSRAQVASAKADAANARRQYERLKKLSAVRLNNNTEARAVSQEDLDNARAAFDVAEAKLTVNEKALELALAGPREEEKAENQATLLADQARLQSNEAQLALLKRMQEDAVLVSPTDGIVRSRLLEPGDMASPQKPVLTIAITNPKWVRAYVAEPDLGKVRQDMKAFVSVDSFPDRRFEGSVGFISPVAEFTPKTVQTTELRTSLVYEVRVYVRDPDDDLRLGMPATVHLEEPRP